MLVFDVLYLEQGQIYTFDNGLDCYGEDNILSHISITDVLYLHSASHSLLFIAGLAREGKEEKS